MKANKKVEFFQTTLFLLVNCWISRGTRVVDYRNIGISLFCNVFIDSCLNVSISAHVILVFAGRLWLLIYWLISVATCLFWNRFQRTLMCCVGFQEAHKLLQPMDKSFKTMAIEFAEYQVCCFLSVGNMFWVYREFILIIEVSVILIVHWLSGLCGYLHHCPGICRHCLHLCCPWNYWRAGISKLVLSLILVGRCKSP